MYDLELPLRIFFTSFRPAFISVKSLAFYIAYWGDIEIISPPNSLTSADNLSFAFAGTFIVMVLIHQR